MESPFIYNKHVTGKNFIGRKADITILTNLLNLGENVVIYEPAKSGKRSLVEQTLFNMKIATQRFNVADVSFLSARTVADLMIMLGSAIIRAGANSPNDYKSIVSRHLEGTHFVFDDQLYTISVGNGLYSGGGLCQTPSAKMNDGMLNMMVCPRFQVWRLPFLIGKLFNKKVEEIPFLHFFDAKDIWIFPGGQGQLVEVDGEVIGRAPVHFQVLDSQINVLHRD